VAVTYASSVFSGSVLMLRCCRGIQLLALATDAEESRFTRNDYVTASIADM